MAMAQQALSDKNLSSDFSLAYCPQKKDYCSQALSDQCMQPALL
jgi:hypothetical protein